MAEHAGFFFRYVPDSQQLDLPVTAKFVPQQLDDTARAFIDRCLHSPSGPVRTAVQRLLCGVLSDFDVNALLKMYPMHLLSTNGFASLLGPKESFAKGIDVGAGNGDVTSALLPLVGELTVCERSFVMRRRLKQRGFSLLTADIDGHTGVYDLVACLNVIDRTKRPTSLVQSLARLVAPGGKLMLSAPLPLEPFYYDLFGSHAPKEPLPSGDTSWERSLTRLASWLLAQLAGFEFVAYSRAPYLSGGDSRRTLYVLDAVLLVFERR